MQPSPDEFEIDVAGLHVWRDSDEPLRLIDCREEDEFAFNRIEGAELIPLSQFAELAPEKLIGDEVEPTPVVIYCHHGMRSLQATHFLRRHGIEKVWSMAGGIEAWSLEIDPEVPRY
jgi:rhodanese-related sulfurtransferase